MENPDVDFIKDLSSRLSAYSIAAEEKAPAPSGAEPPGDARRAGLGARRPDQAACRRSIPSRMPASSSRLAMLWPGRKRSTNGSAARIPPASGW